MTGHFTSYETRTNHELATLATPTVADVLGSEYVVQRSAELAARASKAGRQIQSWNR